MFVVLEGELQMRGELGGEAVTIPLHAGRYQRSCCRSRE